jgi:hypothetical protein
VPNRRFGRIVDDEHGGPGHDGPEQQLLRFVEAL